MLGARYKRHTVCQGNGKDSSYWGALEHPNEAESDMVFPRASARLSTPSYVLRPFTELGMAFQPFRSALASWAAMRCRL